MKIGTRLIVGFLAVTALIWVTFFFAVNTYARMQEEFDALEGDIVPEVIAIGKVPEAAGRVVHQVMEYIISGEEEAKEETQLMMEYLEKIGLEYEDLMEEEQGKMALELTAKIRAFNSAVAGTIALKEQGASAGKSLKNDREIIHPAVLALLEQVNEHDVLHAGELAAAAEAVHEARTSGARILLLTAGFVTILAAGIALFITRSIVRPLNALRKGTEVIGQGNLDYKVGTGAKDEIGQLSRAFDLMSEDLKETTTSIDNLNKEITQRKQAEEKIRQAAEEWETTFESIMDLVSIHDKDFKFVRANKAFADFFKMKPEELIGKHCYEVVHGANEPAPNCPHKQTLEDGIPRRAEFFEPHLGIHLEVSASPIFNEKGEVIRTIHITRDITERKQAEAKLREREER